MSKRRALLVVALVVTLTVAAWAAKSAPAVATFSTTPGGFGVFDDGNPTYDNGVGGVKVYFGVTRKDADLVTYNTGRKLHYKFDGSSPALAASGLGSDVLAESDLFALNYFGPYTSMALGTTAQVQMDLEFKVGNLTYELDYASLAAYKTGENTWLITSDPNDIPGFPGFTASSTAKLNVIRRKAQTTYGTVDMPIRFEMTIK